MGKQIYYEILSNGDSYKLMSVVLTSFGGYARNFVKSSEDKEELESFAEGQGWIGYYK